MKSSYRITKLYFLLATLGMLIGGCERIESGDTGKDSGFRFLISLPEQLAVDTKASLGSINISNVWILQFSLDTKRILRGVYVPSEKISQMGTSGNLLIQLDTKDAQFSNVSSSFYIVANGGENKFTAEETGSITEQGTLTLSDFKKKTVSINLPEDGTLQKNEPTLLISSETEYTPKDGKVIVVSRMYRAFAKVSIGVNFTGKAKGKFVLTGATITNQPKEMAFYEAEGDATTAYPLVSNMDKTARSLNMTWSGDNNNSSTSVFYMAENLRGTGLGTTYQEKVQTNKGPGEGGSLAGCTYLTLKGTYQYKINATDYSPGAIDVEYLFYLGGNFINDYNIYRDYHYSLTINIAGPNSADFRVRITNGNVAVFDDVDEVTNSVDF